MLRRRDLSGTQTAACGEILGVIIGGLPPPTAEFAGVSNTKNADLEHSSQWLVSGYRTFDSGTVHPSRAAINAASKTRCVS